MNVYVNKVTGIDDALVSMLMSKRSWTREKELVIRKNVAQYESAEEVVPGALYDWWELQMKLLRKWGIAEGHTTLLRYIDVSVTVEGLHRAAQDDLDAHVKRMDNRIVRASTRLGDFKDGEVSDWYEGRIMFPTQVLEALGMEMPEKYEDPVSGSTFIKADYGYIREDLKDNKDVKRGLYPLSIPSNCIFKVQLPELAHIYQFRCKHDGHAAPELIQAVEILRASLNDVHPGMGDWLPIITQDKPYTI